MTVVGGPSLKLVVDLTRSILRVVEIVGCVKEKGDINEREDVNRIKREANRRKFVTLLVDEARKLEERESRIKQHSSSAVKRFKLSPVRVLS